MPADSFSKQGFQSHLGLTPALEQRQVNSACKQARAVVAWGCFVVVAATLRLFFAMVLIELGGAGW